MPRDPVLPNDAPPPRLFDILKAMDPQTPRMPVIVADMIAGQIDALPGEFDPERVEEDTPPASAYGVVAPPFPEFFIEVQTELDKEFMGIPPGWIQRGVMLMDMTKVWRDGELSPQIVRTIPPGTEWLMTVTGYFRMHTDPYHILTYDNFALLHINADGYLLDDTTKINVIDTSGNPNRDVQMRNAMGTTSHIPYALKALSALHERTIADKVTPFDLTQRQYRQRYARELPGLALNEHYVLHVKTVSDPQAMYEVGQPAKNPHGKRAHAVRGHFRRYTPERPLFGRVVGAVWVESFERGDSGLGRITKDYELN